MNRAEYIKEWARKAREKDPEKFRKEQLKRAKKSYEKDPEKHKKRSAEFRKNNPEKVKISVDRWFEENKEYRKKYKAKYREQHAEQIKAYRIANRERQIVYKANRKTRLTNAGGKFTVKQWRELCALYDNKCLCCGKKKPLTVDHVIPVSKGGTSDIGNIQPLCGSCNSKKHDDVVDYRKG